MQLKAGALLTLSGVLACACLAHAPPQAIPGAPASEAEGRLNVAVRVSNDSTVKLQASDFVPDWSSAGYHWGEEPPVLPVTHSVRDYGAIPNDNKDDTAAFKRALAATQNEPSAVVLSIPAGSYELSDILFLTRSHFVLQGAGSDSTTLQVNRPLAEMSLPDRIAQLRRYLVDNNKRVDDEFFSAFSWTGGVIWSRLPTEDQIDFDGSGPFLGPPTAAIRGRRGAHEVQVEHPESFTVGQSYTIRWSNREGAHSSFLEHLYGGKPEPFAARLIDDPARVLAEQVLTITSVSGKMLKFREPLLHDVRPEWRVEIGQVAQLEEVGIEGLTISFPNLPYRGHHKEAGFNGIHLNDLRNSWVRDVVVHNSDSGILSDRSSQITLKQIKITGRQGHYGIHCGSVYAMLTTDFFIAPNFAHSVSFNTRCTGSVFHQGEITDGSLDQHRGVNHQNLFDSIVAYQTTSSSSLFDHGGAGYWGPVHGAFNTFWGIEVDFSESPQKDAHGAISLGSVEAPGIAYLSHIRANADAIVRYENARFLESPQADSLYLFQKAARANAHSGTSPQMTESPQ